MLLLATLSVTRRKVSTYPRWGSDHFGRLGIDPQAACEREVAEGADREAVGEHARPSMTQDLYMGRGVLRSHAADALEAALRSGLDEQNHGK